MAASAKVPAAIACGLICFMIGIAAGAAGVVGYGYRLERPVDSSADGAGENPSPMAMGGGMGGMGGGMGGMGGGMGGPSPKTQLATLVTKLDQLTAKSLHVEFTPDQKAKVREQLKGLTDKPELSDEDAKKRLDALLEVLKDKKETMEAAGYRWPSAGGPGGGGMPGGPGGGMPGGPGGGGPGGRPATPPSNPFKEDAGGTALKSLEARLK